MKAFIVCLVTGCLLITNVYALDRATREELIAIYNFTRDYYVIIVRLLNDLESSKIDAHLAEKKLLEWEERYHEKTDRVPRRAQNMRDLMNEMIAVTEKLVDDYRPNHQRTKDLLEELDEIKTELKDEMTELKYMLQ